MKWTEEQKAELLEATTIVSRMVAGGMLKTEADVANEIVRLASGGPETRAAVASVMSRLPMGAPQAAHAPAAAAAPPQVGSVLQQPTNGYAGGSQGGIAPYEAKVVPYNPLANGHPSGLTPGQPVALSPDAATALASMVPTGVREAPFGAMAGGGQPPAQHQASQGFGLVDSFSAGTRSGGNRYPSGF